MKHQCAFEGIGQALSDLNYRDGEDCFVGCFNHGQWCLHESGMPRVSIGLRNLHPGAEVYVSHSDAYFTMSCFSGVDGSGRDRGWRYFGLHVG